MSHPASPAPCVLDALAVGSTSRLVRLPRRHPDGGLSRVQQDVAQRAAGRLQQGTHALRITGLMMPTVHVSASLRLPRLLSDAGSRGFPQDVAECAASLLQCAAMSDVSALLHMYGCKLRGLHGLHDANTCSMCHLDIAADVARLPAHVAAGPKYWPSAQHLRGSVGSPTMSVNMMVGSSPQFCAFRCTMFLRRSRHSSHVYVQRCTGSRAPGHKAE